MSTCFMCGRDVGDSRHGPDGHDAVVQTEMFSQEDAARIERARVFAEEFPVQLAQGRGPQAGKDDRPPAVEWRRTRRRRVPSKELEDALAEMDRMDKRLEQANRQPV